jgi:hypothetical protein
MMPVVRTTVTLDSDVDALLRKAMQERGLSFKAALNEAVRAGLAPGRARNRYRVRPHHLGQAAVPLTKTLQVATELEDEEIVRKLAVGK